MPGKSVYLETFGCQMNELDSELVAGQLSSLGYRFVEEPGEAEVVLYNTCSVRDLAEQKVRSRLGEMAIRKREEPGLVVGVLGCMAERDGAAMLGKFPVVDVLCGPAELDKLPSLLDNAVRTRESMDAQDPAAAGRSAKAVALQGSASRRSGTLAAAEDRLELLDLSRAISPVDTGSSSAYVRITRGCNKFCTYCVVPHTRGAETHRPPDHIVDECKRLADAGVVEVTLLGQTVNHYRFEHGAAVTVGGVVQPQKGRTYKGGHRRDVLGGESVTTFADLLHRIHEEVPAIQRLRFVTSYPRDFGDDVLEVIRDSPRICRYLHVPAQSGSDAVLKRMNRGYTVSEYLEFVDRCRGFLDEPEKGRPLMLSGDMIVGFCGETEEDFEASVELLKTSRYKNCFIFKYSPRPGTTAYGRIPDDVPDEVKRRRNNKLLAVQHEISAEISRAQVGKTLEVYVEGVSARERKQAKGNSRVKAGMATLTVGGQSIDERVIEARESENAGSPVQLAGRTDTDLIVLFESPSGVGAASMIGRSVRVRVTDANVLTLFGVVEGDESPVMT